MAAMATLHGYHVFYIVPCETISIVEKCDRPYAKIRYNNALLRASTNGMADATTRKRRTFGGQSRHRLHMGATPTNWGG